MNLVTSSTGIEDAFRRHAIRRRALYDHMANDLRQQGLRLGGVITQGLTQADLFDVVPAKGSWSKAYNKPKLRRLQVRCEKRICCFWVTIQKAVGAVTSHGVA